MGTTCRYHTRFEDRTPGAGVSRVKRSENDGELSSVIPNRECWHVFEREEEEEGGVVVELLKVAKQRS